LIARNGLTRRANHRHNVIIAKIINPHGEIRRGFFVLKNPESDGGRTSTPQAPTPPAGRRERAAVRTFGLHPPLAGTRERVDLRRGSSPPHAAPNGIRFAPQMIRACAAIMPHVSILPERSR